MNFRFAGVGAYFAKHLKDLGFPVRSIRVSEKSRRPERFVNLKAEHYWGLRERFEAGDVAGLKDEQTISQLATIRYFYNPRGQLHIESKEDARKRGIKSPDRAEAMMLAYAGRHGSGHYELMRQLYEESQTAAVQTDDDPSARAEAATVNLVKAYSAGYFIEIDPHYYNSYIRPKLRVSPDPAAAAFATELDRRFRLTGSSR